MKRSDDPTDRKELPTTTRRQWLRAGLAAGVGSTLLSGLTGSAAAASYDTVTIPAGEVRNIQVDGNQTLENKLYDVTAEGAGVTFRLYDNATIRNVGIKGSNQSERYAFRMGGGVENVTIDHVYTECFDTSNRDPGGMIATKNSSGTINIKGATIKGWGNNGLYASKTDAHLYVEDCFFVNNRTANYRGGGNYHGNNRDAVFRNCVCVIDDLSSTPLYPAGGDRTVGFIARWGQVEVHDSHVYLDPDAPDVDGGTISDNSYCMRTDSHTGSPVVNVHNSQVNPNSRISGDVNYVENVGADPSLVAPDYAPTSAEEAASGATSSTSLDVATGSTSDVTDSGATLNGTLSSLGGASSANVAFEHREEGASSWNTTGTQTLSSTGSFSASVDGLSLGDTCEYRAVATADDGSTDAGSIDTFTTQLPNDLKIDGSNLSKQVTYEVTVSDAIVKGDLANDNDVISGTTADGQVYGGIDTYHFSGEVTDVQLSGDVPVYVNGQQIDPDQFGSGPSVDRYEVTEAGSPNPHANVTVEWDVSDADGNLATGLVEVLDADGHVLDSAKNSIGGDVHYGVSYFEIQHVRDQTLTVRLTVTDADGNETTATQTVTE